MPAPPALSEDTSDGFDAISCLSDAAHHGGDGPAGVSVGHGSRSLAGADQRRGGELILQRSVSDSANLHVPWPVEGYGPLTLASGTLMERPEPYLAAVGARPRHHRPSPQPALRLAGDRAVGARGDPGQAGRGRGAILLGRGVAGRAGHFGRARRSGASGSHRRRRLVGRRLRRTGVGGSPPQRRQSHRPSRRRPGHHPVGRLYRPSRSSAPSMRPKSPSAGARRSRPKATSPGPPATSRFSGAARTG